MLESIFGSDSTSVVPSQDAMAQAKLPIGFRDNCAGLLIPLNKVCSMRRTHIKTLTDTTSAARPRYICHTNAKMKGIAMKSVNTKSRSSVISIAVSILTRSSFKKRVKAFEAHQG